VAAEAVYAGIGVQPPAAGADGVDKQQLVADVKAALFAAKVRVACVFFVNNRWIVWAPLHSLAPGAVQGASIERSSELSGVLPAC